MNNLIIKKLCLLFVLILSNCTTIVLCQSPEKPNVLLIYVDDLRPELASYGAAHIQSPNIDAQKRASNSPMRIVMYPFVVHLAQAC
jgi:hypothetical protein